MLYVGADTVGVAVVRGGKFNSIVNSNQELGAHPNAQFPHPSSKRPAHPVATDLGVSLEV